MHHGFVPLPARHARLRHHPRARRVPAGRRRSRARQQPPDPHPGGLPGRRRHRRDRPPAGRKAEGPTEPAGGGGQHAPGPAGRSPRRRSRRRRPTATTYFISHDHTISILPLVIKNPGYDPARDFVPVAGFATFVNALAVSGGTPAKSFPEYVAWVRQQGGKGNVGVPAPASVPEFLVKLIGQKYGLDLQAAPYRGSAPMMATCWATRSAPGVGSVPDFIENHKAGKIRVVAVMGQRAPAGSARCADLRRARPGRFRGRSLLRPLRAGRHAPGRDRPLFRCAGQGDRAARDARAPDRAGPGRGIHAASSSWAAAKRRTPRPGPASSRAAASSRSSGSWRRLRTGAGSGRLSLEPPGSAASAVALLEPSPTGGSEAR